MDILVNISEILISPLGKNTRRDICIYRKANIEVIQIVSGGVAKSPHSLSLIGVYLLGTNKILNCFLT